MVSGTRALLIIFESYRGKQGTVVPEAANAHSSLHIDPNHAVSHDDENRKRIFSFPQIVFALRIFFCLSSSQFSSPCLDFLQEFFPRYEKNQPTESSNQVYLP